MSFLRVVTYDGGEMTDAEFDVWDEIIGAYLRNNPDCLRATAAKSAGATLVVSEWTSQEANERDMASPEYQTVLSEVMTKLSLPSDIEPSFLFEGDVKVNIS